MGERRAAIIIGLSIVAVVGLILAWALSPAGPDQATQSGSQTEVTDTAAIQNSVQLSRLGIFTSENYVGHKIRLITGVLKNVADKPIRMIEVKMVFTDFEGRPVHEYVGKAFESTQRPLNAGSEYRFEINFENLPRTWNYRLPITEISKIVY